MPLDPTLKRFVAKAYLAGFGDIDRFTLEQKRAAVGPLLLNVEQASYKDYKVNHHTSIRIYIPNGKSVDDLLPGLIYFPGTGFVFDKLLINNDYCSLLANQLNMKIINVSYRLAPEYKFPYYLNDCMDGIEWVSTHLNELKLTPKLTLWGESSGATLGAACTQLLRDRGNSPIAHQTLFYPRLDLVNDHPSQHLYNQGYLLDTRYLQWLDNLSYEKDVDLAHPSISPLLSSNFNDLPATTLITAEYDPLRDEGIAYGEKLAQANVNVKSRCFEGLIHGFSRYYDKVAGVKEAVHFAIDELKQFTAVKKALAIEN